jgi:DNA-binding CsgD family transcriptional regulator
VAQGDGDACRSSPATGRPRSPGPQTTRDPGAGDRKLLALADDFVRAVRGSELDVLTGAEVAGLELLGYADSRLPGALATLQARVRRSVWNMQVRLPFFAEDPWDELNERSRRAGHNTRLILAESGLVANPLVSSQYPIVRTGPVPLSMILLDESVVVYAGLRATSGHDTIWAASREDWVGLALSVWRSAWQLATPVLEDPDSPPLNRRQFAVACFLAQGLGDDAISRRVGVSRRTVASDVRAVMDLLGAQSRFQAGNKLGSLRPPAGEPV